MNDFKTQQKVTKKWIQQLILKYLFVWFNVSGKRVVLTKIAYYRKNSKRCIDG